MAVTVAQLKAVIDLDTGKLKDGTKQAEDAVKRLADAAAKEAKTFADAWTEAQTRHQIATRGMGRNIQDMASQFKGQSLESVKSLVALEEQTEKLNKAIDRQKTRWTDLASRAESTGKALTLGLTAPLALIGVQAIKGAADFEQSLGVMKASSGATAEQMKRLRDQAVALGNDLSLPDVSAASATDAMLKMKQAGLDIENVMADVRPALLLASATMIDNGQAATILTDAINAYGLSASQAAKLSDEFVNAQQRGSGPPEQFGIALRIASGAANQLRVSVDDAATSLALFGRQGLRGELGGTAFRNVVVSLLGTTKNASNAMKLLGVSFKDANGDFVGMSKAAQILHDALGKLAPASRATFTELVGGREAMQGLDVLARSGAKGFDQMREAITKTGTAEEIAKGKNQGLNGALRALKSAFETAALVGAEPFIKDLTALATKAGEAVNAFAQLPAGTRNTIIGIAAAAAAIGPLLIGAAKLVNAVLALRTAFLALRAAAAVGSVIAGLAGPIAVAVVAIGLLVAAWMGDWGSIREVTADALEFITTAVSEWAQGLFQLFQGIGGVLSGHWEGAWDNIKAGTQRALGSLSVGMQKAADLDLSMTQDRLKKEQEARDKASIERLQKAKEAATKARQQTQAQEQGGTQQPDFKTGAGSPLRDEAKGFAEAWAVARLKFSLAKQGIAKDVQDLAAQFSHQSLSSVKALQALIKSADDVNKVLDEQKSFHEALAKAQLMDALATKGESKETQDLAGTYKHLSLNQIQQLADTVRHTKGINDAKEASKKYRDELERVNKAIRDQQASGFLNETADQLKKLAKDFPNATQVELRYLLVQQNLEKTGKDVTSTLVQMQEEIGKNASATIQSEVAWDLFGKTLLASGLSIDEAKAKLQNLSKEHQAAVDRAANFKFDLISQEAVKGIEDTRLQILKLTTVSPTGQAALELFGETFKRMGIEGETAESLLKKLPADLQQIAREAADANTNLAGTERAIEAWKNFTQQIQDANMMVADAQRQLMLLQATSDADRLSIDRFGVAFSQLPPFIQQAVMALLHFNQQITEADRKKQALADLAQQVQGVFQNAFSNLNKGFKGFFSGIIQGFEQMLQQMASQFLSSQLTQLLFGKGTSGNVPGGGGGILAGLGGIFGALFGGGIRGTPGIAGGSAPGFMLPRASGGPVAPGQAFLVGERGPEMFVPRQSGTIAPNGGATVHVNMYISTPDVKSFKASESEILAGAMRFGHRALRNLGG